MSEKRKDNKGRILRTGESQRKDLIYQYRYTDVHGKRQTIYSSDLKELREKEKTIQKQLDVGIDYAAGKTTVIALLERGYTASPYYALCVPSHILYQYVKCGHGYQELARISRFKGL